MKNALLLSLGVVALSSRGYDSRDGCLLRETQKGGSEVYALRDCLDRA